MFGEPALLVSTDRLAVDSRYAFDSVLGSARIQQNQ